MRIHWQCCELLHLGNRRLKEPYQPFYLPQKDMAITLCLWLVFSYEDDVTMLYLISPKMNLHTRHVPKQEECGQNKGGK